jgi:CheY-like chemotaxis protein
MVATVNQSQSVLVVDDEADIRALLGRALQGAGFTFDEAADGDQALSKLARHPSDVVVIDIIMPTREGVGTIIEIRQRWPDTYIVAISGAGRIGPCDFLELAQDVGADRTLSKPFTPAQLLNVLAEASFTRAAA